MPSDLLPTFRNAFGWNNNSHETPGWNGATATTDVGPMRPQTQGNAAELLGGAVGGFGLPMSHQGSGFNATTNAYSAVGGSASRTADGYGFNGGVAPIGLMNTNLGFNRGSTSGNLNVGDAYYGKREVSGNAGESNGVYHADGAYSQLYGVNNVNANLDTQYGNVNASVGSYSRGTSVRGGGSYDSNTGVSEVHGEYGGPIARDVNVGYQNGDFNANAGVGRVMHGTDGNGSAAFDPRTGTFTAAGNVTTGGNSLLDVHGGGSYGNTTVTASAGEISNNTQLSNLNATVDSSHARVGGDYDGGGWRVRNAAANAQFGNYGDAQAHIGELGSTNSVKGAYGQLNFGDLHNPSIDAGAKEIAWGSGIWGQNIGFDAHGPGGSSMHANVGSFSDGLEAKDVSTHLGRDGLTADVGHANYSSFRAGDVDLSAGTADYNARAHLGSLNTNSTDITGGHLDAGLDHLNVSAQDARYDAVRLQNASVDTHLAGIYDQHASIGDGSYNSFHAQNVNAGLDRNGLHASLDNGSYSYLQGTNIDASQSYGGGAVGTSLHADTASLGGVTADHLDYQTTLRDSHLSATNLGAHGFDATNLNVGGNVGNVGASAGANRLGVLDLNLGQVDASTSNFGTQGTASVRNANLDLLNVQGGHAGLTVGGQEMVGARGDLRTGGSVESASGNYNLMNGTANGSFQNANFGSQVSNASLNLGGMNVALPDAGYNVHASGSGAVNAREGSASGNLSLAGSSVNLGGHQLTLPEYAQANGDVNLSRGTANAQVGGRNGVGGHVDVSRGELTVNAFGQTVDVAGGARTAVNAVANTASNAYNGATNMASNAYSGATNMASSAVNNVSNFASSAMSHLPKISMPHFW